nr:hypothetical protein [Tanacetum cinerariifolium]
METKDTLSLCSNSEAQHMQQIQDKAKKSYMVSFQQLHSHIKRISQNDLQGSRTESGFKRAFATLSGQDIETFTGTMFLNVEQLEKQLDKEDFQEIGSMAAFNVLEIHWVNERQMQTTEEKVDTSKALDASSVDTECSRTESKEQDTSSRSRNDAHDDDDAYIRPIYDEEPMVEVNSHDKVPSNKTMTRSKPVEQISVAKKLERQIPKGHRFSIQKTSIVQKKTMTPRSCLRWKPMGKIFKTVGLRWVPTGRILTSNTTKVDNEPLNGLNADITNQYECEQILDVSAGTSFNLKEEGLRVCIELEIHDHNNEPSSSKLVPNVVPPPCKTVTTRQALELLFHHHITMLSEDGNPA